MPIQLAERSGKLNAPSVNPGKAYSYADESQSIGEIGSNTLKMINKAGSNMAKVLVAQKRQQETLSAQDALTEYLAGRQKLDTVRDSLTLEQALAFEDKYYKEAEKMHAEFVNKINRLQYADIRERTRGQVNNTNITEAAKAENFFWKQKEAVEKNHTDALVEVKKREVVNSVNSNPGMENYNKGNIAAGYSFIVDEKATYYKQHGYVEGSPELKLAMSKVTDDYFSSVLTEVSHKPNNGVKMAHDLGKAFKEKMSPAVYNQSMQEISRANLSEQLIKNPKQFFKGDVLSMATVNWEAVAKESDALRDDQRRSLLSGYVQGVGDGKTSENAAKDALHSAQYMQDQAMALESILGTNGGLMASNGEIADFGEEAKIKMSKHLQQNVKVDDIVDLLFSWDSEMKNLTDQDSRKLLAMQSQLISIIGADPDIGRKALLASWFKGRKPTVSEVMYATVITAHIEAQRKAGGGEIKNLNLGGLFNALKATREVIANKYSYIPDADPEKESSFSFLGEYVNNPSQHEFDSLAPQLRSSVFSQVSHNIAATNGSEYALRMGEDLENTYKGLMFIEDFNESPVLRNIGYQGYSQGLFPYNIGKGISQSAFGNAARETYKNLSRFYYVSSQSAINNSIINYVDNTINNMTTNAEVPLRVQKNDKIMQHKQTFLEAGYPEYVVTTPAFPALELAISAANGGTSDMYNPFRQPWERQTAGKKEQPAMSANSPKLESGHSKNGIINRNNKKFAKQYADYYNYMKQARKR